MTYVFRYPFLLSQLFNYGIEVAASEKRIRRKSLEPSERNKGNRNSTFIRRTTEKWRERSEETAETVETIETIQQFPKGGRLLNKIVTLKKATQGGWKSACSTGSSLLDTLLLSFQRRVLFLYSVRRSFHEPAYKEREKERTSAVNIEKKQEEAG